MLHPLPHHPGTIVLVIIHPGRHRRQRLHDRDLFGSRDDDNGENGDNVNNNDDNNGDYDNDDNDDQGKREQPSSLSRQRCERIPETGEVSSSKSTSYQVKVVVGVVMVVVMVVVMMVMLIGVDNVLVLW